MELLPEDDFSGTVRSPDIGSTVYPLDILQALQALLDKTQHLLNALNAHKADPNPHGQYLTQPEGTSLYLLLSNPKLPPYTRATLPLASDQGAGAVAYVSDPQGGRAGLVLSTGTVWVYMDGSSVS